MTEHRLNRFELSQYSFLRSQIIELDERIREVEAELAELDQYNFNISPVYTGMPTGNERRDKIADFIIRLNDDRKRLNEILTFLVAERAAAKYRLHKIRTEVNNIPNKEVRDIIIGHYFDGQKVSDIAEGLFMTSDGVYKKINRYFKRSNKNRIRAQQ